MSQPRYITLNKLAADLGKDPRTLELQLNKSGEEADAELVADKRPQQLFRHERMALLARLLADAQAADGTK